MLSLRGRAIRVAAAAAVIAGTTTLWSGPASAKTCPTLGIGGTVTPPPAPGGQLERLPPHPGRPFRGRPFRSEPFQGGLGARQPGRVSVTLAGPGIKATAAICSWHASGREFACTINDPHGIRGEAANPEVIHLR